MSAKTETPDNRWPLGDMEAVLIEMESFIRMIGHLASSANEVSRDEWIALGGRLLELQGDLERHWRAAWDLRARENEAHKAELAAAKQARAAPGSEAEIKRVEALWSLAAALGRRCWNRRMRPCPRSHSAPSRGGPEP